MNYQQQRLWLRINLYLVTVIAQCVTSSKRQEWLREWQSEVDAVHRAAQSKPGVYNPSPLLCFSSGCIADAWYLRFKNGLKPLPMDKRLSCLGILGVLAAVAVFTSYIASGPKAALHPFKYENDDHIVYVSDNGFDRSVGPSIDYGAYLHWRIRHKQLISQAAYFQTSHVTAQPSAGPRIQLSVVSAENSLYTLLQPQIIRGTLTAVSSQHGGLLISEKLWKQHFQRAPDILDQRLAINGHLFPILAVVSEQSWPFPGNYDAWIFLPSVFREPAETTKVFVVARLNAEALQNSEQGVWSNLYGNKTNWYVFDCTSIAVITSMPLRVIGFALFLALLAVPAANAISLGEYPSQPHSRSLFAASLRWCFLAAKMTLIVITVGFGTIDIAYFNRASSLATSEYITFFLGFLAFLISLRWMLHDQKMRCPVCLRHLEHPVNVGHASHNLLAWGGTEWICVGGHGFLHVPHLPTSWFQTQRWLYADPSWRIEQSQS